MNTVSYSNIWQNLNEKFPNFVNLLGLLVLQLLVPILITCLLDPSQMKLANPLTRTLHTHALHTLTRIGTQYPQVMEIECFGLFHESQYWCAQEFKTLLSCLPDLRSKLESAARANQSAVGSKMGSNAANAAEQAAKLAPTIKLKTDFSNFSSLNWSAVQISS